MLLCVNTTLPYATIYTNGEFLSSNVTFVPIFAFFTQDSGAWETFSRGKIIRNSLRYATLTRFQLFCSGRNMEMRRRERLKHHFGAFKLFEAT